MTLKNMLKLIRPKQWAKNVFVLMPLFFSGQLTNSHALMVSLLVFVAFCLTASSVYCINDIVDVEADINHPVKCKRPIASGHVTIRQAWVLTFLLVLMAALLLLTLPERAWMVLGVVGSYYVLNIGYCCQLADLQRLYLAADCRFQQAFLATTEHIADTEGTIHNYTHHAGQCFVLYGVRLGIYL